MLKNKISCTNAANVCQCNWWLTTGFAVFSEHRLIDMFCVHHVLLTILWKQSRNSCQQGNSKTMLSSDTDGSMTGFVYPLGPKNPKQNKAWHRCGFVSLVSLRRKRERRVLFTSAYCAKEAFKSFSHVSSTVGISFQQHCPSLWEEHPIIDAEHPERLWCVQLHNNC